MANVTETTKANKPGLRPCPNVCDGCLLCLGSVHALDFFVYETRGRLALFHY